MRRFIKIRERGKVPGASPEKIIHKTVSCCGINISPRNPTQKQLTKKTTRGKGFFILLAR